MMFKYIIQVFSHLMLSVSGIAYELSLTVTQVIMIIIIIIILRMMITMIFIVRFIYIYIFHFEFTICRDTFKILFPLQFCAKETRYFKTKPKRECLCFHSMMQLKLGFLSHDSFSCKDSSYRALFFDSHESWYFHMTE